MKHLMVTLALAIFTAGILRGQEISKSENENQDSPANYVSLDKTKTGDTVILIKYPWRVHEKASIEARLITEKKDFDARVRPLRFATIHFDRHSQRRIYDSFDHSLDRPSDWKSDAGGLTWRIIAHGNHLGHAAAWFVNTPKRDSPLVGTTATFYPLDPWAIDDRLLVLDLPRGSFEQPGKMHVWFLRGERIFWHEELPWPGRK
jgi:hypothetical protein